MRSLSEKCLRVSKTESYGLSRICFEMRRQATMPSSKAGLCLADEPHNSRYVWEGARAVLKRPCPSWWPWGNVRSGAAVALGTELNFWIIKNHAALETSEVCSLCTVVYHDARMKKKILIFFQKLVILNISLGMKLRCVWSAAKHNKSRCALLKEVRFQETWKNVVQTCHTPLESLNFSGSYGANIYF
jgi:hypothetical protein